jgi:hypothetical protein
MEDISTIVDDTPKASPNEGMNDTQYAKDESNETDCNVFPFTTMHIETLFNICEID